MNAISPLLLLFLTASAAFAGIPASYYSRALFSDDFSSDGFGKRWSHYKSASVVKDGVLTGITAETSDHPAVDAIVIEPERDLEVSVKFKYVSDKANGFNIWLDDKTYEGSHAGHICSVVVNPTLVIMADAKTGRFMNELYEQSKTKEGLTPKQEKLLLTKSKNVPVKLTLQDWHTLVVRTKGDEIEVSIDGKDTGSFKSEGIGHDAKSVVSLTTNRMDVVYDDFSIKAAAKPAPSVSPITGTSSSLVGFPSSQGGSSIGSPSSAATQTDPNQPRIETLSQQALNAEKWVVAPLDESVPGGIRQNLVGLREDLADEGKKKPKVGIQAYSLGYQLCNAMIDALDERGRTLVKAGYTNAQAHATTGVTSQALESNRNYMMSWPQYKREQAQRGELFRQKVNGAQVMKEQTKVDWSNRAEWIKRNIDRLYGQFREAMRESPSAPK